MGLLSKIFKIKPVDQQPDATDTKAVDVIRPMRWNESRYIMPEEFDHDPELYRGQSHSTVEKVEK